MRIREIHVTGYRSVRDLRLPLRRMNVLVGANGCGKSNLYQALVLLSATSNGTLARTLASEGGMPSVLWAGPARQRNTPRRVGVAVTLEHFAYELSAGLPVPDNTHSDYRAVLGIPGSDENTLFQFDPLVREEKLVAAAGKRKVTMLDRRLGTATVRNREGALVSYPMALIESEAALSQIREPHLYPELSVLRNEIGSWRFYHQFRTDADSPLRQPQIGTRTPVLAADGNDIAAALQTILENGDAHALRTAIEEGLPGSELRIESVDSRFSVTMHTAGLQRPLAARELSDGTLRYLCLVAALLSPRPPSLLALNEPETSLHPDLIRPLARLMADVSRKCQLWVTTHSSRLAEALQEFSGEKPILLEKVKGETTIAGAGLLGIVRDDDDVEQEELL